MLKIIPSILTSSKTELNELLRQVESATDRAHIDIIDGIFANNTTIIPEDLESSNDLLNFDYHLMTDNPISWLERITHGQNARIIGQIELMPNQQEFLEKVKSYGSRPGLALDIDTAVDEINQLALSKVEVVLVMSVKAGFGGQEFYKQSLDKVKRLAKIREAARLSFSICDDGGVTLEKVDDEYSAGADEVVIGRRLFEGNLKHNIINYQKAAHAK